MCSSAILLKFFRVQLYKLSRPAPTQQGVAAGGDKDKHDTFYMARTGDLVRCGVCGGDASTASCDEATFVAECSHVFHFRCVVAASAGTCPVCDARWRQALAVTLRPAPAVQLVELPGNHRPNTLPQESTPPGQ
jgi:hypothetical protein